MVAVTDSSGRRVKTPIASRSQAIEFGFGQESATTAPSLARTAREETSATD